MINGIENIEVLKRVNKKVGYFYILMYLPLIFINEDIIKVIYILKTYADYIGSIFMYVEHFSLYSKAIGEEYYTIKFIYSYSAFVSIISYVYLSYVYMNIYLYNLSMIKSTKYNVEIIAIKETGSWHHFTINLMHICVLAFCILFWMSDSDTIVYTGKYTTETFTYKYIAIFMSGITSLAISYISSLISIDILAKIYSRNFRIFEPLRKEEKNLFIEMKKNLIYNYQKKIFNKTNKYLFIFTIIVVIYHLIRELTV